MFVRNINNVETYLNEWGAFVTLLHDLANNPLVSHSIVECLLKEWTTYPTHLHKLSEESYYILWGTWIMYLNNESQTVKWWDFIFIPRLTSHWIHAITDLRLLAICAPAWKESDVFTQ
jgi:mannose-6-phosphate isomerase-like protein (cupin superfamily)